LESYLDFFRDKSDKWDTIVFWSRRAKELLGLPESDEDVQSLYCRVRILDLQFNKDTLKLCGTDPVELHELGFAGIRGC